MLTIMPRKSRLKLPPLNLGNETIGQRIARLRKERGHTQVELAQKIGLVQILISNYETNKLRLHAEMVVRFAIALDVTTDELLGARDQNHTPDRFSRRVTHRMRKIEHLPQRDQKALFKTIDTYIKAAAL